MADPGESASELPLQPIDRLVGPIARFLHVEASSGVVLVAATAAALIAANSPLAESYAALWKTPFTLGLGDFVMRHSLQHWINDGLMAIFFFVIGLEVKREIVLGELRDPRRAALPVAAALGGMIAPAGLYLLLQGGGPGAAGWGIPMATDIAFVVGVMAVLGSRIPSSVRVMLLSLAIVDDIGAILVIAIGYTDDLAWSWLGWAGVGLALIVALGRLGVRSPIVYLALGAFVWLDFHESGVHATIAGVLLGLLTPARSSVGVGTLRRTMKRASDFLHGGPEGDLAATRELQEMETAAREVVSPLRRLEYGLHPWTAFAIMPIFAFANAGVAIELDGLRDPIALAIVASLALGKPLGVLGVSWLAVRLGLARLPDGVGWGAVTGAGCLAGIGFTMAIFIAGLALEGAALDAAKIGVLAGSGVSLVAGVAILVACLPKRDD